MFDFLPKPSEIDWDDEVEIIQPEHEPVSESKLIDIVPEGWQLIGERNGKPWYRTAPAVAVPKPRINPIREAWKRLALTMSSYEEGKICPACLGTGYIRQFQNVAGGICYKCNDPTTRGGGKGYINGRDKAYNDARIKAGTACDVVTV